MPGKQNITSRIHLPVMLLIFVNTWASSALNLPAPIRCLKDATINNQNVKPLKFHNFFFTNLQEEGALVLGLRAGGPKPVGQWPCFGCGHKVTQCHWLLQDVGSFIVRLHAVCTLALRDTNTNPWAKWCSVARSLHFFCQGYSEYTPETVSLISYQKHVKN